MIDSWGAYRARKIVRIPGSSHSRWVSPGDLLAEMTPEFRKEFERQSREVRNEASRRVVLVATRKYRARKGR